MATQWRFHRSARRLQRPAKAVLSRAKPCQSTRAYLRSVCSAKLAREYLGLSLLNLAKELSRLTGETVTKNRARHFESGCSPIPNDVRLAYGVLLANRLTAALGREVAVTLSINSPWAITPHIQCRCGRWTEMITDRSRNCPACAQRRR